MVGFSMAKVIEIEEGKEAPKIEEKGVDKTTQSPLVKKKFNPKALIFPLVAILSLVGIGAFYYFAIYKLRPTPPSQVVLFDRNYISPKSKLHSFVKQLPLLSQPQEPRTEESPLNGLLFTKKEMEDMRKRRPVAVMTNNHVHARSASGYNSADIVYEANAEGGITRNLAIYWSSAPDKVGPIRSLRQYYLEWLSEYDPILIRDGCAESTNPKANACGNVYAYGIKDISTIGAWRWNDGRRVAPHNEYSSVKNAWEYGKRMNWNSFPSTVQSLEFKNDADMANRGKKSIVKTVFHMRLNNGGAYDSIWTYDQPTNTYYRKVGGKNDIDQETNTQVTAKNIVIQKVKMSGAADGTARVVIPTVGEGEAVILQDGKIINGKWKKASRTERTKFYDNSGNTIKFNRGRIWISALPQSDGKFDIIEQ